MTNDDGSLERIPNLDLAALKFQYGQLLALGNNANATATHTLKAEILVAIEKEAMTPFYKYLGEELKWWPIDPSLVAKMSKVNEETVASWDFKRDDAEKNLGDTEILDALLGKANYYCQIADKVGREKKLKFSCIIMSLIESCGCQFQGCGGKDWVFGNQNGYLLCQDSIGYLVRGQ